MAARHYVPQWVLRQFKLPHEQEPYELDIHTGRIDPRNLRRKAGAKQDFWPEGVERKIMTPHDTEACAIYRQHIANRLRIQIPADDKLALATWLALFMARTPTAYARTEAHVKELTSNPQIAVDILHHHRNRTLEIIRHRDPEIFNAAISELGQTHGEEWLMALVEFNYRRGIIRPGVTAQGLWESHLLTLEPEKFAPILCQYQWTWFYSRGGFVIGDNPLIRWSRCERKWDYGIKRAGIEITFPISASLCLRIRPERENHRDRVLHAPKRLVWQYNRRQRCAAFSYVYSGERKLLEPWRRLELTSEEAARVNADAT